MKTDSTSIRRILYAEDTESDRALVSSLFPAEYFAISVAANGQEAVEKIRKETFDLVLMDLDMPVMNGVEAIAAIRGALGKPSHLLPILGLDAEGAAANRNAAFEAGMDDFISKPIEKTALLQSVEYWLGEASSDSFSQAARVPSTETAPDMDHDQITMFKNFIGAERTKEIIREFQDFYEERVSVVFDPNAPREEVERELHALASTAGNIGLTKFTLACRTLMNDLIGAEVPDRQARLEEINALYKAGIEKLDGLLHAMTDDS